MDKLASVYGALASVLKYPEEDYHARVDRCVAVINEHAPSIAEHCGAFRAATEEKVLAELEELYIQTFDLNPLCALDLGWQLFKEDYNRGLFLVKMREAMRGFDIPESTELPDHISHVLAILARMDDEIAEDFAIACVIPALRKVREAVPKGNPYASLIKALVELLETRFGPVPEETDIPFDAAQGVPTDALQEASHE